jgi:hypothetical protein
MLELSEEFDVFVVSLHTLYLDSVVGFNELHRRLLEHQDTIKSMLGECEVSSYEFQDQCSVSYETLCGERFNVESTSPLMRQGEVKERTARDGINYILMGRLCVVHAFGYWEAYLRAEVRTALGFENSPKNDFWGDMRLLRNAILHNKGKANPDFDKMKVFKWFKPGDQINLDFEKVKMIFAQMANFRNYLHALSLPPHDLRFPSRP